MTAATLQENKMGVMPVGKLIANMALPMVISMLVQALYNVVDSIYVSQVSESAVTALSLAFPIQNLLIGFAVGIGVGVNSLLSKSLGEKNQEAANRAAGNGIVLMAIAMVLFVLFGLFGVRPYFAIQSDNPETVEGGIVYTSICCVFSVGCFASILGERLLQSTGRTVHTMITQSIGAIINIILDPILIHGWFGLPAMGIAGAAIATVIGQWVSGIMVIISAGGQDRGCHSDGGHSLHRDERHRLRDEFRHQPDFAGLRRDGDRRVRRVFQAPELLLHAPVRPEQRHHFHHCL